MGLIFGKTYNYIKTRVGIILDPFYCMPLLLKLDREIASSGKGSNKYSLVLSLYKRSYLHVQLLSVLSQSKLPSSIYVYQNGSHVFYWPLCLLRLKNIRFTWNMNWNALYHGRFWCALSSRERYVIVWDDDIIPQPGWNEYSISKSLEHNGAIVTGNCRFFRSREDVNGNKEPDAANLEEDGFDIVKGLDYYEDIEVDYGGHSWTLTRKALLAMAYLQPRCLDNSEDLHLSASNYILSKTKTIWPALNQRNLECWPDKGDNHYASDVHASHSTNAEFEFQRVGHLKDWLKKCFVPVVYRRSDDL